MKSPLFWQVYERLTNEESLEPKSKLAVEASFDGSAGVEAAIAGDFAAFEGDPSTAASSLEAKRAYLTSIEIEGFRGIGPKTKLQLKNGPGLTVIVGRNGSGKSSFAEGMEVLLTGASLRWSNRKNKEWMAGWQNLHHHGPTSLVATLSVEGRKRPVTLRRVLTEGVPHEDSIIAVDFGDKKADGLGELGWEDALKTYRPILSYNELGNTLDEGPSHLFDLLRDVLGMDAMTGAADALQAVQKRLNRESKVAKDAKPGLITKLKASEDSRAEAALKLIERKNKIDVEALTEIAVEGDEGGSQIEILRRIASLKIPDSAAVKGAIAELRAKSDANTAAQASAAGHQLKTESLLKQAMTWFESNTDEPTCPVCGEGVLDDTWLETTKRNLAAANEGALQAKKARAALNGAVNEAKRLIRTADEPGKCDLSHFELAREKYDIWTAGSSDEPRDLANHMETTYAELDKAINTLKAEALKELETAQEDWRPIRRALENWIDSQIESEQAKADNKIVKDALAWLRSTDETLRAERFEPIKQRATEIWNELRHQSNVQMTDIRLEGKGTRRQAIIDVSVDEEEAVALGVMSQGELHAMLLSLFLPRLTLPESPFGFLIIDDPVQAMDPAKVEGLANVLAQVAKERQVLVFTHDARLPEAVRRLQISATVLEVNRKTESQVSLRETKSAPRQFIDDALQVARDTDFVGPNLTGRVVPGLCRAALEARFKEIAWTKLLGEGMSHLDVESTIHKATGMHNLATLALLGDANKGKDLFKKITNSYGQQYTDTFVTIKEHAHQPFLGNAETLIRDTQALLYQLEDA